MLVAKLGSNSYAERDAAMRALRKLGRKASTALVARCDDANLELRRGVRELMVAANLLRPGQRKGLDALLAGLRTAKPAERVGLVRRILALGKPVLRHLQAALERVDVAPLVEVRRGALRFLIPELDEELFAREDARALRTATWLVPGKTLAFDLPGPTEELGLHSIAHELRVRRTVEIDGQRLVVGSARRPIEDDDRYPVSYRVTVLPDWRKSIRPAGARFTLSVAEKHIIKGYLTIDVVLRNDGKTKLRIDKPWMRYIWVALLDRDGKLVATGGGVPGSPGGRPMMDLAPGKSVTTSTLVAWPKAGSYTLVGGYHDPKWRVFAKARTIEVPKR